MFSRSVKRAVGPCLMGLGVWALVACGGGGGSGGGGDFGASAKELRAEAPAVEAPAAAASAPAAAASAPAAAASAPAQAASAPAAIDPALLLLKIVPAPQEKATAGVSPTYRFFNTKTGTHFYTISQTERNEIIAKLPQFVYEGTSFFAFIGASPGTDPVYRFFNRKTGTHFFTTSEYERDQVRQNLRDTYDYEGTAWYAAKAPGYGDAAVYRFFNTRTGTHFYTSSAGERDSVIARLRDFVYEGIAYYAWTNPTSGGASANPGAVQGPGLAGSFTTVNLSVNITDQPVVTADLYAETWMPDLLVKGTASGDFTVLNGKTLYIIVVDPDGLFQRNAQIYRLDNSATPAVQLQLRGNKLTNPGTYRGNLQIYACLDTNCATRLGNTPHVLPYDVKVRRNAQLPVSTVELNALFGARSQTVSIPLTPPEGRSIADMSVSSASSIVTASVSAPAPDGSGTLDVSGGLALPGKYKAELSLSTRSPGGGPYVPVKSVAVNYTIAENPAVDFVFSVPELNLKTKFGDRNIQNGAMGAWVQNGTMRLRQVEFLTTAAQDAAIPATLRNRWIGMNDFGGMLPGSKTLSVSLSWLGCYGNGDCMPPDTYPFRAHFVHTLNGITTDQYVNGRMVIEP
ncbi:MAG: hypothetical protein RET84_09890 [Pseudomonadota bacterium]|nr:hypothetical protein [Pseudomonadota bacterium]